MNGVPWCRAPYRLLCLMCCTGVSAQSQTTLPFVALPACARLSPARFSVRVLLLLLSGETGQPGAQQHGCCRPGPCAVIRPANLAGTCKGKQRIQDNNLFSLYFICASVSRISPKTRESASVKCGQISLWTGDNWFDFGFNQNVWASRETLNNSYLWSLFSWKLLTSLWDWD